MGASGSATSIMKPVVSSTLGGVGGKSAVGMTPSPVVADPPMVVVEPVVATSPDALRLPANRAFCVAWASVRLPTGMLMFWSAPD